MKNVVSHNIRFKPYTVQNTIRPIIALFYYITIMMVYFNSRKNTDKNTDYDYTTRDD